MAKKNASNGTLFMAMEVGATWPARMRELKSGKANFQAIVQDRSETAEHFAGRTLEKWHELVDTAAPPFRFMLSTRPNPDDCVVAARERIARGVLECRPQVGPSEIILWSGTAASTEEQSRLLALAGALVQKRAGGARSVRVLFGSTVRSLFDRAKPQCDNAAIHRGC